MAGRPGFIIAGVEIAVGAVALTLGFKSAALSCAVAGALILAFACVVQVIDNHHERKTNGRYRKAPKAHRAGAGGGSGYGTRAGRGARGRAGAGMNPNFFLRQQEELEARQRAILGLPPKSVTPPKPQPRPAGEFDGTTAEFAAGVVTGTRSFDVDKLGRLVGVSFRSVWTPGENTAECLKRDDAWVFSVVLGSSGTVSRAVPKPNDQPHSIVDCSHGFYGYYEGSNDYYEPGRVMGVVEAYGETVIGTRGFRASKARIVALHLPKGLPSASRKLVARNYAGIPFFDSFDAMVAEFPPDDAGHGINPSTDPDFWTRKA